MAASTTARVALVEHEQQRPGRRCRSCGRPRPRRRGGARPASPRGAGCAGRRRARRGTRRRPRPTGARRLGAGWTRSRAPVMTPSVPSDPTNSWVRSGPTAALGAPPVWTMPAVGQDDVEPDDHVLDLPVAGRVLAGRPAGQPAADRRQVDRLRPVAERQAVGGPQLGLERRAEGAGQDVDHQRGVVDVDEAGQRAQVEDDAAVHRDRPAAHAAAPGRRRSPGRPRVRAHAEHGGHLGRSGRPGDHDDASPGTWPSVRPGHGQRPPVAARLGHARPDRSSPSAHTPASRVTTASGTSTRGAGRRAVAAVAPPAMAIGGAGRPAGWARNPSGLRRTHRRPARWRSRSSCPAPGRSPVTARPARGRPRPGSSRPVVPARPRPTRARGR